MSSYRYPPLHPDTRSIRLVRLLPAPAPDTRIKCQFTLVYLGEGAKYDAVSYFWGTEGRIRPIELGDQNQVFMVSPAVEDILLRLRDPQKERLLWLDLVCIDQSNKDEKDRQVKRMKDIFAEAQTVIASLGPHIVPSKSRLQEMDVVNPHRFDKALNLVTSMWSAMSSLTNVPLSHSDERDLLDLLNSPWFERVWVVQEVAVARRLVVVCGTREVEGKYFGRLHKRILSRVRRGALQRRLTELGPLLSYMSAESSQQQKPELLSLLQTFRPWKASVPHDKIYALLGLSADGPDAAQLAPNYRLSVEVLYQRVVEYMVSRYKSLTILTYATGNAPTSILPQSGGWTSWLRNRMNLPQGLPSWCPDWREPYTYYKPPELLSSAYRIPNPVRMLNEARNRIDAGSDYDSGILRVSGFTIGTITSLFDGSVEVVFSNAIRQRMPGFPSPHMSSRTSRHLEKLFADLRSSCGQSLAIDDRLCILQGCTGLAILRPHDEAFKVIVLEHSDFTQVQLDGLFKSRTHTDGQSVFGSLVQAILQKAGFGPGEIPVELLDLV